MSRLCGIAALLVSLTLAGCSTPTQPLPSLASMARQGVPRPTGSVDGTAGDRSAPQVSGAFRHDDFVITVHGVRLDPNMFVQATYDLDPESQWPLNWTAGMDFLTSIDGRLWEYFPGAALPENTGAVARLWGDGKGFSYSVPLSAMHEPAGPITFAIIVASYDGSYYFRAFGRADCRQCTRVAARL